MSRMTEMSPLGIRLRTRAARASREMFKRHSRTLAQPTNATLDVTKSARPCRDLTAESHLPGPSSVAQIRRGSRPRLRSMIRNGPCYTEVIG